MVGRRHMAAAVAAGMPLGCIVRAERWTAGAHGPGAVCCTAVRLALEQSWPWRRVVQSLAKASLAYAARAVCSRGCSMLQWLVYEQQ